MVETEAGYVVEGVVSTRCGRKGVLVRGAGESMWRKRVATRLSSCRGP